MQEPGSHLNIGKSQQQVVQGENNLQGRRDLINSLVRMRNVEELFQLNLYLG